MAVESITKTLGSGSGLDLTAIVTGLVDAQFAVKKDALVKRQEALTARISGVSSMRSAVTGLDAALSALVAGGTLSSRLTSSDEAAVKVTALAGGDVSATAASIGVVQLASAQVSSTDASVPRAGAWRTGTLTLRTGREVTDASGAVTGFAASGEVAIAIGDGDATLDGIAARINAANAGVKASVVADGDGARLVLRGASGGDAAFELTGEDTGGDGLSLSALAVGRGATATTSGTRARDAIVQVDGVRYRRPTNVVEGVVPGVQMTLGAVTAAPVTVAMTRPTAAIGEAVGNFVAAFNEISAAVKAQMDPVSGALRDDPAGATLARSLRTLTTTVINASGAAGAPRTLADLGVGTGRDGTLTVDDKRLKAVLAANPAAVEAMFAAGGGLSAKMGQIATVAKDENFGLTAAAARYQKDAARIGLEQQKLTDSAESARTRLTRQFATMDARVAAYKSTQTFLTGQIAAWNRSDG